MEIATLLALGAALAVGGDGSAAAHPSATTSEKPTVHRRLIPIDQSRRRQTSAYGVRHYGRAGWTIRRPRTIVEHLTVNDSVEATYNTFAPNVPDGELGELPGVCTQFVIARGGAIFRLTPTTFMCRHTVGLNWAAIGIEHVGYREQDVLGRAAQLRASLRLTRWLRCRYRIPVHHVIGHAESLTSPFHRERVASLRSQTHGDWQPWAMRSYRAALRKLGRC